MLGNAETQSRSALLHEIDKVSFAVNDLTLYLDTHPDCQERPGPLSEGSGQTEGAYEPVCQSLRPVDCRLRLRSGRRRPLESSGRTRALGRRNDLNVDL